MVKLEDIPTEAPAAERPVFKIGFATTTQEEAIREYAAKEGFATLRGYWMHLQAEGWDYYDVLQEVSP